MRVLRLLVPVVAGLFAASAAQAAPSLSSLFTNAASFHSHLGGLGISVPDTDRQFVGIARVGNNNANPTAYTRGWEAGLFNPFPNAPTFSNGVGTPGQTVWPTTPVGVTLSRTGNTMTFSVGDFFSASSTSALLGGVDTLAIQARSTEPTSPVPDNSLTWSALNLTGLALPIPTQTASNRGNWELYQVVTGIIGDFNLSGSITLTFDPTTNARPPASRLAFRIAGFNAVPGGGGGEVVVPVPAAFALFGFGLLLLGGIAARRRA